MPDMHIPIEMDWVPEVRKSCVQDKGVDQTRIRPEVVVSSRIAQK